MAPRGDASSLLTTRVTHHQLVDVPGLRCCSVLAIGSSAILAVERHFERLHRRRLAIPISPHAGQSKRAVVCQSADQELSHSGLLQSLTTPLLVKTVLTQLFASEGLMALK